MNLSLISIELTDKMWCFHEIPTHGLCPVQELPSQISSEEQRELLALMCRVHELEVEKMALQSERLIKQHELRRRDLVILRYDQQRHLCEEIITRQRQLMEGNKLVPVIY
jgi:kinesin family protein 18/19